MLHCLESSIEIRMRTSIGEVVRKRFRDWTRPARVRIRHGSTKASEHGSAARPCKIGPNEQGSCGMDEWFSTGGRGGISMKAGPSFLQNEHTRSAYLRRRVLPFQNVENSRTDEPDHHRQDNVRLCRPQVDKRPADLRARL